MKTTKTKRIFSIVIAAVLVLTCLACFAACRDKGNEGDEKYTVKFFMPDGTPALAAANLLNGFSYSTSTTEFNIVTADQIATAFNQGADFAIMPTIAAAKLYSNGAQIKLVSTNVFGNLFIMGVNTTATTLADLKGKVVMVTVGTTLSLTQYLLRANGIEFADGSEPVEGKVVLNSVADASTIIPKLKTAGSNEVLGLLGEPQVTKAKSMVGEGLKTVIDLQAEWTALTGFTGYPQASLVATSAFCEAHPDYIAALLSEMEKNADFISENLDNLPEIFAQYESNLANMTFSAETITGCNLRVEKASAVKASVKDYLSRLGQTVDDGFFYVTD